MALGIEVDFIGVPLSGAPPVTVAFTDLSVVTDGFKRLWFWDFGDGESSTDQNPTHEYNGVGGESFTVKLRVLITTGEFTSLAISDKNAVAGPDTYKTGWDNTEALAWDAFQAATPSEGSGVFTAFSLTRTGGATRQYTQVDVNFEVFSSFDGEGTLHLLTVSPSPYTIYQGNIISNGHSHPVTNGTARQTHSVIEGMPKSTLWPLNGIVRPIEHLPDTPGINQQNGIHASFACRTYYAHSLQKTVLETKEGYVNIGTAPEAYFDAAPRVGPNNLWVQFENLSVPALGAETLYSWKRRLSGSGDPFVEFSTAENPLVLFIK